MKWYKPDTDEIIFDGTEVKVDDVEGTLQGYLTLKSKLIVMIKNDKGCQSRETTRDEMLLKCLDEADILDLGWEKFSNSNCEYRNENGNWFLTLAYDKIFIREIYSNDIETDVKNKQQLKLLMQFLGISQNL